MIELADIIAPIAAPPAPPPYGWIALGAAVFALILFFGLWFWLRRTWAQRRARALLAHSERALHAGKIDARAAAFEIARAIKYITSLPPPSPSQGEGRGGGDAEWADFTQALTHARFSPHPIDTQHAAQLLAQARQWIARTPC